MYFCLIAACWTKPNWFTSENVKNTSLSSSGSTSAGKFCTEPLSAKIWSHILSVLFLVVFNLATNSGFLTIKVPLAPLNV